MSRRNLPHRRRPRHGIVFITAVCVVVVLGALVLIFARSMRTELTSADNRVSAEQASTIELGAEQYVISAVDACDGDAVTVMQTPAEQVALGDGYFWIMQPYPTDDSTYAFGITDENQKLNINYANDASLATLPGITQDVADSIIKWIGSNKPTQGQGADNTTYGSLPRPYALKSSNFETVEELYLIPNVSDTLLWGYDLDHNGMVDQNELAAAGLSATFNAANDTGRGIFPFITVWGIEPNTYGSSGKPRAYIGNVTGNNTALRAALQPLPAGRINQILSLAASTGRFLSIFQFAAATRMTPTDFSSVADHLTTSRLKMLPGLVNVNTAPQQVLMCLPQLTQEDAANIVAQRPSNTSSSGSATPAAGSSTSTSPTSYTWIQTLLTPPKLNAIAPLITGHSYFYSADIVAVSGDGRGFKRARIVVDARNSPPVIVYRKDLTYLGWPLSPDILKALKTHQPLPAPSGMGTGGANGISSLPQSP